ncbi:MAG: hypothetical protein ACXWPM_06950 [Bdellovibrionota bacterium]
MSHRFSTVLCVIAALGSFSAKAEYCDKNKPYVGYISSEDPSDPFFLEIIPNFESRTRTILRCQVKNPKECRQVGEDAKNSLMTLTIFAIDEKNHADQYPKDSHYAIMRPRFRTIQDVATVYQTIAARELPKCTTLKKGGELSILGIADKLQETGRLGRAQNTGNFNENTLLMVTQLGNAGKILEPAHVAMEFSPEPVFRHRVRHRHHRRNLRPVAVAQNLRLEDLHVPQFDDRVDPAQAEMASLTESEHEIVNADTVFEPVVIERTWATSRRQARAVRDPYPRAERGFRESASEDQGESSDGGGHLLLPGELAK